MRQVAFQRYRHTCYVKLTLSQQLSKGCDDATGEAGCEARAHNLSRRKNGTRCGRTGSFADGSASAYTIPTADIPQSDNISPNQRFVLGEEEMADVSLATFYLFDKENAGGDVQLAAVVVAEVAVRWLPWLRLPWRGAARVAGVGWLVGGCAGCPIGGCCARWVRCRWC